MEHVVEHRETLPALARTACSCHTYLALVVVEVARKHFFSQRRRRRLPLLFRSLFPRFRYASFAAPAAAVLPIGVAAATIAEARALSSCNRRRCLCGPEGLVLDLANGHIDLLSPRRSRPPPGRRLQHGQRLRADGGRGEVQGTPVEVAVGGRVAANKALRDGGCRARLDCVSICFGEY